MPYPHGFGRAPIVQEPLAGVLRELSQRVISFDPPGMFNTTRPARVSMSEMLDCAEETLSALKTEEPLTLVGHSMGGFCAIAYALAYPERVQRVIIIGSLASASAIQRHQGLPWGSWLTGRDRWHYILWGFRLSWGLGGNLALHKQMLRLLTYASYIDKRLVPHVEIDSADQHRPAPVRDVWPRTIFANRLDYRARLSDIRVPALIGVGRRDPQAPVGCSEEIARGIPGAQLVIFEHSGHYPYVEERDLFKQTMAEFLA
ncbi:MAG TPA: alpha/beta hydrolase [Anaerolineae bacterium]|nr:alpha/beta hydrolase [Anaerolineae bacterium]